MLKPALFVSALALLALPAAAEPIQWPAGKKAAIVLTYDDAMTSQLDNAIPQLDKAGLKGTFFLNMKAPTDLLRWRTVSRNGHELGNHTETHPCPLSILPGRPNATDTYTEARILGEIAIMNSALNAIDGPKPRTLAYPCAQTLVGGQDYRDALRRSGLVKYARNGGNLDASIITDATAIDLLSIPASGSTDSAELIAHVKRVEEAGGLSILVFHGVGGEYLSVSAQAHQELVDYLRNDPDIWVGTFQDVMDYVTKR
ncbi:MULTISPECIES: polysaccharide deacetylase family protein [Asticcacaulis]|uniref:polysaccharide deacetylase family protein n=1 Tax=Asticcacaulis TaxID=76890 RepID=UPI001AE53E96|nr:MULTISPECIES: polysaccharide deacetylase family protein [Asticcacaulis]MBP2160063.1 peptidoglycan/xylan/chitin deacetylase (PgdA/CDA1 family) [Asticcacaulis solisilvae]MDR6801108.1 peptidoglycan/xylan/chitin deacetylase (PgdA/CDA1 family) [Asticcacaulis sp. BE141]